MQTFAGKTVSVKIIMFDECVGSRPETGLLEEHIGFHGLAPLKKSEYYKALAVTARSCLSDAPGESLSMGRGVGAKKQP